MQLSKHFSLEEMTISQTASRLNIDNIPPPNAIEWLKYLCVNILEPMRMHFGRPVVISSGYRSDALNRAIGGSPTSKHRFGQAADLIIPGVSLREIMVYLRPNELVDQCIEEFGRWVHVGTANNPRKQFLQAYIDKGSSKYVWYKF